jgi:PST family polysaccharide transporter
MANFEPLTRYLPASLRDRLEHRPNLWRILANVGWLFGDRILRLGMGLLVGVWVARFLGPEQFGLLNYAVAYAGLFLPLALLGLDQIVVRDLVNEPARRYETLGTAFSLKLLGGVVSYVIAVVAIVVVRPASTEMQLLVALAGTILMFQAFDVVDLFFQSQVRSKYAVVARNAGFLVVSAVRVGLILAVANVIAFAGAVALEALLAAMGLALAYRLSGERFGTWRVTRGRAAELLRTSWPLVLSGVAITVYMRIDQIMLGEMIDDAEVGIYSAAVRISELWYFIPVAIVSSVAPAIASAKKTDEDQYQRRVQQLLYTMALLGYVVALPVSLIAGPLVQLLYGQEYARAGAALAVHIWAGVFVNLGGAHGLWHINEGRTGFFSVSTALGAVLNVVLNLILIPQLGAAGAAIATLVSYGVTVAVLGHFYKPTRPLARITLHALLLRR